MTQFEVSAEARQTRVNEGALLQGWISRTDLAQELGVCEETLRRWADARRGPAFVKAGRKILYRKTAVLDWLEAQEVREPRRSRSGGHR
jgi:excisionase family DNA binding protein